VRKVVDAPEYQRIVVRDEAEIVQCRPVTAEEIAERLFSIGSDAVRADHGFISHGANI